MKKLYKTLAILLVLTVLICVYNKELTYKIKGIINSINSQSTNKRLVIGRSNDSISLDPAITTEMDSFKVTVNIFDTLVKYEAEGNKLIPGLAQSWKSSEDGLIWVFRLRQDVKFHDGTQFNAQAVEFNFKRWMDPDSPYHIGDFSYWSYIFGGFPGIVKSVTTLSDYSLEIVLARPYAPFLSVLSMPAFGIASPEAIVKYNEELSKHPVGTGPFYFKSWNENKSIILARNNKYWDGNPKINEVEFRVIPDNKEGLEQLKSGSIHILDNLVPGDMSSVKNDVSLNLHLRPSFNVGYLAMNNEKPPFNNREVRVALNHAIDKDKLINDIFYNIAKPANTFVPPSLWGHNEKIKPYEYNPEKSGIFLEDAGYSEGFKTTLWVMNNSRLYFPEPVKVAQFIKENLKEVNIEVEIEVFNMDEFLAGIKDGKHEMALVGWTGDTIDPDNFLYTFFASHNAKPGLAGNYSFYNNKDVDLMLSQARQSSNMAFRKNLYRKLQETVNYDAPGIPLVHTMPAFAASTRVKGYTPHLTGVESLELVDIND